MPGKSPHHLATLRNQVTSPGGTSAEALYHLEKGGLRTVDLPRHLGRLPTLARAGQPGAERKLSDLSYVLPG